MEKIPNQNEQETVRIYCLNRELIKPKTNIITAFKYLLIIEILIVELSYSFDYLFVWFRISISFSISYLLASTLVICVCLKKLLILSVKLYQYYASEQIRRKCTLMPSCSEYTILALQKHGVIMGLYKAYFRVFKKCKGNNYSIDYP